MKPLPQGGIKLEGESEIMAARYAVDAYAEAIEEDLPLIRGTLGQGSEYLRIEIARDQVAAVNLPLNSDQARVVLSALHLICESRDLLSADHSRAILDSYDNAVWERVKY